MEESFLYFELFMILGDGGVEVKIGIDTIFASTPPPPRIPKNHFYQTY